MLRSSSTTPRVQEELELLDQPAWVPVLRALLHPAAGGGGGGLRTGQSQVKSSGAHCSASGRLRSARLIRAVGRIERVETNQIVPQKWAIISPHRGCSPAGVSPGRGLSDSHARRKLPSRSAQLVHPRRLRSSAIQHRCLVNPPAPHPFFFCCCLHD